jgi:hypothetical protein
MIKNVIALYPGRFQPFGKHHAEAFKWLENQFGAQNCYIVTSNVVDPVKSPFSFKDKHDIISNYGFADRLVQVKNPYKAEEITAHLKPEDTALVFMVGAKDMKEDPRFKIGTKKDGNPSYFQEYDKHKSNLKGFDKHGYLVVAPHVSMNVPGYGEMSGTTLRSALGDKSVSRDQRVKLFKAAFGWYNEKTAKMIFDRLEGITESKSSFIAEVMKKKNLNSKVSENQTSIFTKEWWSESLDLTEAVSIDELKSRFKKFIAAIKIESKETKEAFNLLVQAAAGKKTLTDSEKKQIGEQFKDVLKTIGLTAIAVLPGGIIAGILIKVLKMERYVTPSAFIKVEEGYMTPEQQKEHDEKMIKLKDFLKDNEGKSFIYDFNDFPKTVYGVKMPTQGSVNESLINEGGAGGHMAHPFNIDSVKTGKDLVKVFVQSVEYLKKGPASVKIDGVNASIRLITLDGKKVFVMDRGSNKPLDVKGITKAELEDRFGAGHGMIKVGGTVLDIFNDSLPAITPALKKLGLWDNPNIMFNLEYVAGSTNVLSYNKNFLAVHGLLEIEQVTPKRRATKEIKYSKPAMQDLLNNLVPVASKNGYEVLGSIPTTLDGEPDLTGALNKKYTVNYGDKKETKTLSQWLAQTTIPDNDIKTTDGKRIAALSKDVLIKISEGTPLPEYIADPKDYKAAVDGFVTYMATMKLGDAILEKLNSPLGPVSEHEGIVIRDPKISKKPFKITGKFILGGLATSFRK